ncbi:cytochrome P450 [Fomitiporia mediterranea MF3/22]|uniref:cytochrome P450 n=1 Tax=Fomitiporia mediterranea (strain MF3/22) TaxID=694068 RepID=UPI000440902C|nr:cytochrome P450 [Fomitiporia mediterranea MF3/22]EJD00110.1 cytochrome P450 [Fomitiporia mediterranea MF3/22]
MAVLNLPFSNLTIFSLVVLAWVVHSTVRAYLLRRKMPPGPTGIPLLGNVLQMPTSLPWIRFAEYTKKYGYIHKACGYSGPVVSFNAAGHPVIVLNDHKSAFELLERRSLNYSHRPRFIKAGELLCDNIMLSFIPYGDLFRRCRRVTKEVFGPRAAEQFIPMQEKESTRLLRDILCKPEIWEDSLKRSTASNILTATYGWPRITDEYLPLVKRIHDHTEHLSNACIPGCSMVDTFPFINHFPLWMSKWKRDCLAWHKRESAMFEGFNSEVEKKMEKGEAPYCFVTALVEGENKNELSKKEGAWLAGIMFSAGAETTSASLQNFLIAMIHYPRVLKKAQHEIDTVIGRDRLPTFEDRPNLPYVGALVRELLRWRPAGPMGIPRRVAEDDWYEGYFIPKGATVISNIWAIDRDPALYTDPEEFIPERFLDETGTKPVIPGDTHSLGHSSFGFGRRTCVGVYFAQQSLFINFAQFLWAFNIEKARDAQGNEITPSLTEVIDAGVTVGPASFQCKLSPRYPEVLPMVEKAVANIHLFASSTWIILINLESKKENGSNIIIVIPLNDPAGHRARPYVLLFSVMDKRSHSRGRAIHQTKDRPITKNAKNFSDAGVAIHMLLY